MKRMWEFKTERFTVAWDIEFEFYPDLSWDDSGEVASKIEDGSLTCFNSFVRVYLDGIEIACDVLCESIYENSADFRDHIGINKTGSGSYFSDMVRSAISEARNYLNDVPEMRG